MLNPNWPSRYTYYGRYEDTEVTDRVYEYQAKTGKKNLKILDVGCSVAIATNAMQKNLLISGIHSEITGIDISPDVKDEAEKNLDKFLFGNIMEIDLKQEFDVVICSKMVFFATAKRKAMVLSQCSKFLHSNGGLITDAHSFEYPTFYQQMKEDIVDAKKILWKLRSGPKKSFQEWRKIIEFRFKRKVRLILGKDEVLKYTDEILFRWKKLKPDEKISYLFEILMGKFSAHLNRNPNYKKIGKNIPR